MHCFSNSSFANFSDLLHISFVEFHDDEMMLATTAIHIIPSHIGEVSRTSFFTTDDHTVVTWRLKIIHFWVVCKISRCTKAHQYASTQIGFETWFGCALKWIKCRQASWIFTILQRASKVICFHHQYTRCSSSSGAGLDTDSQVLHITLLLQM